MPLSPEVDLVDELVTALSLTAGTDIFDSPVRPPGRGVAEKAIFISPSGGPAPQALAGQALAIRRSALTVRVRGDQSDFDGGLSFARSARDAIQYAALAAYIDVRIQETDPIYLGQDDEEHHEWNINVEMSFKE